MTVHAYLLLAICQLESHVVFLQKGWAQPETKLVFGPVKRS